MIFEKAKPYFHIIKWISFVIAFFAAGYYVAESFEDPTTYTHFYKAKVLSVRECLPSTSGIGCRVVLDNENEEIVNGMVAAKHKVYQTCWIEIDKDKPNEWCYTNWESGMPASNESHDEVWKRFKKDHPDNK